MNILPVATAMSSRSTPAMIACGESVPASIYIGQDDPGLTISVLVMTLAIPNPDGMMSSQK